MWHALLSARRLVCLLLLLLNFHWRSEAGDSPLHGAKFHISDLSLMQLLARNIVSHTARSRSGKASCTQAVHTNLNPPCLSLHYQLQYHYHQCYVGISWLLAFSLDLWISKRDQPEDFQLHFGSCGLKLIIIIIIIIRGFQVPVFQELDVNMYQVL